MADGSFLIEALRKNLPPVFSRQTFEQLGGGLYTAATLAKLDCLGMGPRSVGIGKRVCYERESFLTWLAGRVKEKENGKIGARG